jgi:hypothetical protein
MTHAAYGIDKLRTAKGAGGVPHPASSFLQFGI